MDKNLKASIIISTYNREENLKNCLDSLIEQEYKNFEVIVISGTSTEKTGKIVSEFSDKFPINLIIQKKKGLTYARNLGWRNATGEIISFVDDDIVISRKWLQEIIRVFSLSEKIGGVTGPTIIPEDRLDYRDVMSFQRKFQNSRNLFWRLIGEVYLRIILEGKLREVGCILRSGAFSPGSNYSTCLTIEGLVEVDYLEACNMSFRRNLIEKVGGFDETYIGTAEWNEPDLCFRIKNLGYQLIFNPKSIVEHWISQSGVYQARTNAYERSWNFIYFYCKNIKPDTLDKVMRFGLHLLFINAYWFYKFITTKNIHWLSGIIGTLRSLKEVAISKGK